MFSELKADIACYAKAGGTSWLRCLLTTQGLWALTEYRYSHWVETRVKNRIARRVLKTFGFIWHKWIQIITGMSISNRAKIGAGLRIVHFGGIFIADPVVMGKNCTIMQGVTIGWSGRGDKQGCPVMGDRVYVGAGAKVLGKITIGSNVAIGANAVVTRDVPDNAVVAGVPAKIISYAGAADYIDWQD